MALSKKAKIWLIILAIPVVLVIAGAVALKMYFTSDRLKALVLPKIEEAVQRPIAIQDLSLSIFPRIGIAMEGLRIGNPRRVTFSKDEFVSLDELVLSVKLFPLFKGRVEIDEVVITHPRIYLEVTKEGIANYTMAAPPPASVPLSGETPEAGGTSKMALLLSNFRIANGEIEFIDRKADRRILVQGYNQFMRATIGPGASEIFLESESSLDNLSYGSTQSFLISNMPVNAYQRFTYKTEKDVLSLDSIAIGIREISLVLRGTVTHAQTAPILDLTLRSSRAELAQLLSLVPKDLLKTTQGLATSGKFQLAMSIKGESSDTKQPGVDGTFAIEEGKIRYEGLPKSITNLNLQGSFQQPAGLTSRKAAGKFEISKLSAMFGTNPMSGKLSMVDFDDPTISASFTGEVNLNEVKEFYPLEAGTELSGKMAANVSLAGKAKVPSSIKAEGRIEFRGVTIKTPKSQRPLENLNGTITFNNQLLESKQLSMNIGQSDMVLQFTMRNYLALVMPARPQSDGDEAPASGKPSMITTLTSKLMRTADFGTEKKTGLSGGKSSGATEESSMLPGFGIDANVSIAKLVTERFEYENARGSMKIRNGIITLQNFSLNTFDGSIITKGMIDMRRSDKTPFDLDLDIVGVEGNKFLTKFTSFGTNLFGKFSMNSKMKGDLDDTLGLVTKTLNGEGKVQIFDGKLIGYPLTMKLADYTGLNELRSVEFKNWTNEFTISDGRIHIKDAKIAAANTDFTLNGSQGLEGSLDYKMLARLPESASSRLTIGGLGGEVINFLKDKEGRLNLNFNITGTASSPSYALDTHEAQQAAKQALEQKVRDEAKRLEEEAKKKGEEELKKKAEEGLKKLFKRP